MNELGKNRYKASAVEQAFTLLRYISAGNQCSNLSQTAKETKINRTTLLRLLHTLSEENIVEKIPANSGYRLGTALASLAINAVFSRDLVQIAQPILREIALKLGLSAHLGIIEQSDIVYLVRETPNLHLVSNVRVGSRLPAHAITIGRIILAHMDKEQRQQQLKNSSLESLTDKTATTMQALNKQLDEDLAAGVAWSVGYFESGIGSCAAAIFDISNHVGGGINLTGAEHHFTINGGRREEISKNLKAAAHKISEQLGFISHDLTTINAK